MGWRRVVMTSKDKTTVWKRWHEGRSMSQIAPEIGKTPASVFGLLRRYGGIEPRTRTRRPDALTEHEREESTPRAAPRPSRTPGTRPTASAMNAEVSPTRS